MNFKELQAFAKDNDISGYESAKSKTALLKYLDSYFQKENDSGGDEKPPVLNAGDVE